MEAFINAISHYPTSIYTVILGVVLLYWLIVLLGLVDIDLFDGDLDIVEMDLDSDIDGSSLTGVASFLLAFGLTGVPISVVISLIALIAWFLCGVASQYILPWVPTVFLQLIVGSVFLVSAFFIALPITAHAIRPMKKIFVTHNARHNADILGRECRITTLTVSEKFGQAYVETGGAGLTIAVRAKSPNELKKNAMAKIVGYSEATGTYEISQIIDEQ